MHIPKKPVSPDIQFRRTRISALLLMAGFVLGLIAAAPAEARGCANKDFKGRYAYVNEFQIVTPGHEGLNYNVGSLVSDGKGLITEWKRVVSVEPPPFGAKASLEADQIANAGGPIPYRVDEDCRIQIEYEDPTLPFPGDQKIIYKGYLVSGGSEAFWTSTLPTWAIGLYVVKSVDPPSTKQLDALRRVLDRLAVRHGFLPDEEEEEDDD